MNLPVYAVNDEWLEQNGAVVRFTGEFVHHSLGGGTTRGREVDAGRGWDGTRLERGETREDQFIARAWCWRGKEKKRARRGKAYIVILKYRDFVVTQYGLMTSERSPSQPQHKHATTLRVTRQYRHHGSPLRDIRDICMETHQPK